MPWAFARGEPGSDRWPDVYFRYWMSRMASTARRVLWLVCLCTLFVVPRAQAWESALTADFDGDGRDDRVTFSSHESSIVRVWLSATKVTFVIRTREPLRAVAAADLDGDHRAELVASNTLSGVRVWTGKESRFRKFRQKHTPPPLAFSGSRHRASDKGAPMPPPATDAFGRIAPMLAFAVYRGTPTRRVWNFAPHLVRGPTTSSSLTPFSPRPPPTSLL
jgi:hypothetical protein